MTHEELYARACQFIPGGVNSPVRAFNGVGGAPLFVVSGKGRKIFSADGRQFTDYCCSWGAMILGHAHPEVVAALQTRAALGTTFGIATPDEVTFAERLCSLVPGLERVRAVNSGTEAVMTAVRLARGATGRNLILKFDGCYHGHSDAVLISSGSGLLTGGISSSLGVPPGAVADTLVAPYNDLAAVEKIVAERGADLAAVLVEPVAGNMGLVPPAPDFLKGLRDLCTKCGALLVCDEVINGFRFAFTSYSSAFGGIRPDLITLGKVIGGGLPLAAVGGRADLMDQLAPTGKVYQAGTLSGNPLAVAAGLKVLEVLGRDKPYERLAKMGGAIAAGVDALAAEKGIPFRCARLGGVFTLFASAQPVTDLASAKASDTKLYAKVFHGLYDRGVYIAPSQFEVNFVSAAHTPADVDEFLSALSETFKTL